MQVVHDRNAGASAVPIVSIVITYYNQASFIRETVQSAINQSYRHIDVIVVDDGSEQPVMPLLSDLAGPRIFRTENRGCPGARNFGFLQCIGDYLVFLDGDDVLLPDAVDNQLAAIHPRSDAAIAFGAVRLIDASGRAMPSPRLCRPRKNYFLMFMECNPIACPGAAIIRRSFFVSAGTFDATFRVVEDYDLYLRLLSIAPAIRHTHCVALYRQHSANLSKNRQRMFEAVNRALDKVQASGALSASERRRLRHGRRRWAHVYHPKNTVGYLLSTLYFKVRAMLTASPKSYFAMGAKNLAR